MKKLFVATLAALGLATAAQAGPGDWTWEKLVPAPELTPGVSTISGQRLTADSLGQIYIATNSSSPIDERVWKATNFDAVSTPTLPDYVEVVRNDTLVNGFQGMVCDDANNVYLLGEGGANGTNRLYKFNSAGVADPAFGTAGVVALDLRHTGMGLMSDGNLLATNFGGNLYKIDAVTGDMITSTTAVSVPNFVRDLSVKQDAGGNDVIFLNRSGDLVKYAGGSVSDLAAYTATQNYDGVVNADTTFNIRAGLVYFEADDTVIFCNKDDQKVYVCDAATGAVVQTLGSGTEGTAPGNLAQPSDVAVFQKAGVDYLVIVQAANVLTVYTKPSTTSSVIDWSVYEY